MVSNPTIGMDVYVYTVLVFSCAGSGLEVGVLLTVYMIKKL
jgi:hypothetical protein